VQGNFADLYRHYWMLLWLICLQAMVSVCQLVYGLAEPHQLLVAVRSGEHYCSYVGSPACSQIHTQAYFIAFFQASATALIRASLFWDVIDVLKQLTCPICQVTSSPRQMVPICSPSTSVA